MSDRELASWDRLVAEGDRKIAAAVEADRDAEIARLTASLAASEAKRVEALEVLREVLPLTETAPGVSVKEFARRIARAAALLENKGAER